MKAGWRVARLGEICIFNYGKALPESARKGGGTPVFGSNGIVGFHDSSITSGKTIVIGRKGSFGEVHYSEVPSWPIDTAYFVDEASTEQDMRWLFYRLGCLGLNNMNKAAAVPGLNREDAYRQELLLPPLPEQRRIAAILDKADALRTKRREALAQLDRLAQSIFVEMFGEPVSNPKGWPRRTLKELGKVSTGGTPPSAKEGMFGGDIPFVTPGDLESGQPIKRWLTEAGAEEVGTVRTGAALVCCIGATIGKMGMAPTRSSFNQQLNAVEWQPELMDDRFGLAALRFFKVTIATLGASTTLPILKKSSFEKLSIPVPPRSLQVDFAKRLSQVEHLEQRQQMALQASTALFESLQQRAFQGEL